MAVEKTALRESPGHSRAIRADETPLSPVLPGGSDYPVSFLLALESVASSEQLLYLLQQGLRRRASLVYGGSPQPRGGAPDQAGSCHRVDLGDLTLAWLQVDGRPLEPSDLAIVRIGCRVLAGCLWQEQWLTAHWQAMLNHLPIDVAMLDRLFALRNWSRGTQVAVIALRTGPDRPQSPPSSGTWMDACQLESSVSAAGLFFSRNNLHAAFVEAPAGPMDRRQVGRLARAVRKRFKQSGAEQVSVGFGGVTSSLSEVPALWRRACTVLAWGEAAFGQGCVVDPGSVGMIGALLDHVPVATLIEYARARLEPVLTYDQASDGQLYRTLELFLEAGGNAIAASQRLFIHYNTLRHRLRRIEELLSADLTVLAVRLDLWACVLVLKLHRQPDAGQPNV